MLWLMHGQGTTKGAREYKFVHTGITRLVEL